MLNAYPQSIEAFKEGYIEEFKEDYIDSDLSINHYTEK
jgi:hypothetical protein